MSRLHKLSQATIYCRIFEKVSRSYLCTGCIWNSSDDVVCHFPLKKGKHPHLKVIIKEVSIKLKGVTCPE